MLHLTEKIQDLLVVTKLLTVFDVFETEQEAITSFTPNAGESLDRLPTFDYLEDFFPISNELTQKIVEANSQLILNEEKTIADEDRDE